MSDDRKRLAVAISSAFFGALLLFLAVILPAEFGRDPLRTGALLGLDTMSNTTADALHSQLEIHKSDEVEFILEPFQSLEYKYLMDLGQALVFSWEAEGELYFDMHADNITVENYDESYLQGNASSDQGMYEAAFNGMHGWFWENRGFETVTLTLKTSGFYIHATEYRGGSSMDRELQPVL
ncbi:hypothetical protein [Pseudohongiella sp. O18]|uniref:hypothetical protein n=1 Tax=Pseudohongiella sp. O18 TaxID=2904248 RepID=UPI001F3988A0|nr:hypothetical protein [Pseudohongiella sp. O18]